MIYNVYENTLIFINKSEMKTILNKSGYKSLLKSMHFKYNDIYTGCNLMHS